MKKSHRVAHENQRRGGFCYYHYTTLNLIVKNSFPSLEFPFLLYQYINFLVNSQRFPGTM